MKPYLTSRRRRKSRAKFFLIILTPPFIIASAYYYCLYSYNTLHCGFYFLVSLRIFQLPALYCSCNVLSLSTHARLSHYVSSLMMLNTRQIRNSVRGIMLTRLSSAAVLPFSHIFNTIPKPYVNTSLCPAELTRRAAYTTFLRRRDMTSTSFSSLNGKRSFSSTSTRSTAFASFSSSPVVRAWEERSAADAAAHSEYLLSQLASFDNLLHLPDNQLDLPLFTQELAIDEYVSQKFHYQYLP